MDATLSQKITALDKKVDVVQLQLESFKQGFPFLSLVGPATPTRGIQVWEETQVQHYQSYYSSKAAELDIVKFVPASGAASRMFKDLFSFLETDGDLTKNGFTQKFIDSLKQFAFYQDLDAALQQEGESIASLLENKEYQKLVAALLTETGLNYGNLPKGLLKFHAYGDANRCPAEEHLIEGVQYGVGKNKQVHIHFTVSPEHEEGFVKEINQHLPQLQEQTGLVFRVSYSHQKKSTDTIAVDEANEPFLEDDGSLLFRPAGHGALLENLNEVAADLIFIKNIDNVVVFKYEKEVAEYKKMLAGLLLKTQEEVFKMIDILNKADVSHYDLVSIAEFLINKLNVKVSHEFEKYSKKYQIEYLIEKLDRPIRVCGMVKNEGEPGGGPFWVKEESGNISLQIVESAQVDRKNKNQKEILKKATHFNPVDIVCGIKNHKGEPFDLQNFVDHKTAFITMKTKLDKDLKALELPGLWNGSMASWNTIFVEVPLITFNPVKTVTDLLKPTHQIR